MPWTSCRAGSRRTGIRTSPSASGGSASAWPAGRRRRCPPTPTARACPATTPCAAQQTIAEFGALGAPGGLGLLLAAPTIATHGTQEQIERYVRDIVTGRQGVVPAVQRAGRRLRPRRPHDRAVEDGDEWVVNGQKVWTSGGQIADLGMLIARTDPDVPKHQGITYFAIDMHQPGVEIRPLREMTGHAMFNEVFLTDARVPDDAVIGDLNNGWAVANTTLTYERRASAPAAARRRRGDGDARHRRRRTSSGGPATSCRAAAQARKAAAASTAIGGERKRLHRPRRSGTGTAIDDPTIRQDLVRLHTLGELGRFNNQRLKAGEAAGGDIPGMANISKLSMSDIVRLQRDLGLAHRSAPRGMLHAYDDEGRKALDEADRQPVPRAWSPSTALVRPGAADLRRHRPDPAQHHRRARLGLPKEPGDVSSCRSPSSRRTPEWLSPRNDFWGGGGGGGGFFGGGG